MSEGSSRLATGREVVGGAIDEACSALIETVDAQCPDLRRDAVVYYVERMLFGWVPRLMDAALTDDALRRVNQQDVKLACFLLLRDFVRHEAALLRRGAKDGSWVEDLFIALAGRLGLSVDRVTDDGRAYPLTDISQRGWAEALGSLIGVPAVKLFACHEAIVSGAAELGAQRWWQFWRR